MTHSLAEPITSRRANASLGVLPNLTSRTRVLHLIAPSEIGGAESVVRLLAATQRSMGARVGVVAVVESHDAANGFLEALRVASVDAHRLVVGTRQYRREQKLIAAICQATAPDVVHSHGYRTDIVDALYVRSVAAIVSTVHGFTGGDLRNRLYQWLQCRAYRRFDGVVAVSDPLSRHLEARVPSGRLHLLPNAYSSDVEVLSRAAARAELGMPNDGFTVGWVGRFSAEKGPDLLLEALARPEVPTDVTAAFVGDGPLASDLRERAARLHIAQRVSWIGAVPNAERLLSAFDVLVLSSRTEGTPMVILEAMAAQTPIVATRVGGVPHVLSADTALLVEPESSASLAAAIHDVFCAPVVAKNRAGAARRRLDDEYRLDSWADRYEWVYQQARARAAQRWS